MDTPRKPLWPKIVATVVVVLPFVYILSVGPVRGIASRWVSSEPMQAAIYAFYLPLLWAVGHSPLPVQQAFVWYADLWMP